MEIGAAQSQDREIPGQIPERDSGSRRNKYKQTLSLTRQREMEIGKKRYEMTRGRNWRLIKRFQNKSSWPNPTKTGPFLSAEKIHAETDAGEAVNEEG